MPCFFFCFSSNSWPSLVLIAMAKGTKVNFICKGKSVAVLWNTLYIICLQCSNSLVGVTICKALIGSMCCSSLCKPTLIAVNRNATLILYNFLSSAANRGASRRRKDHRNHPTTLTDSLCSDCSQIACPAWCMHPPTELNISWDDMECPNLISI